MQLTSPVWSSTTSQELDHMQCIYFCGGYQICFPLSVSPKEVAAHLFGLKYL